MSTSLAQRRRAERGAARQRPLLETREQALGVSAARLAARTNQSLATMRAQIERLYRPWQEIDESVRGAVDELLSAFDRFEEHVKGSVEWLREPESEA